MENIRRKCKKRLTFQPDDSTDNDKENALQDNITKYFPEDRSSPLPVSKPFRERLPENHSTTPLEFPLSLSGLNSMMSSPRSTTSLSDINFIASPSAIYINKSTLCNLSDLDEFFQNLEKQISESKNSTPEQNNKTILCVQAQISLPPKLCTKLSEKDDSIQQSMETKENVAGVSNKQPNNSTIIPNILSSKKKTIKKNYSLIPQVSYAEFIPIEDQKTIEMPTNQDKNRALVVLETLVIDNIQNVIAVVGEKKTSKEVEDNLITTKQKIVAKDLDEIEAAPCDENANKVPLVRSRDLDKIEVAPSDENTVSVHSVQSEDFNQIEIAPSDENAEEVSSEQCPNNDLEAAAVNLPNENSKDDWQVFALEKPDSPIRLSRKRKRNVANWKDNKNKKLKNSGKCYESVRAKKKREEKRMGATCSCKRKCYEKIDPAVRENIFKQYWGLGDHEKQWEWILRHVMAKTIKKMQLERKCNRTQTISYMLPSDEDMKTEEIVCKKMFTQTLNISEKVIYTAIEKRNTSVVDLRGKHENRPRKIQEDTERSVTEHINEFPTIDSHYTRKRSSRAYLSESLNISKMYRYYKEWFVGKTEYRNCLMATKYQYDMIFNTQFNISFFKPKKDQCEPCSIYNNADQERKIQLKDEHEKHLKEKDKVREIKNSEKCVTDNNVKTIACFDLEKVLYVPQSEVSTFYYKRKFAIYNFTVYDLMTKQGYCYLWNQCVAKRGANEIGSCLWHYINEEKNKGKTGLSLYSDACTGQNRNRFIFAMYQRACKALNINITHRFFVSGHSQSEGDMMHSCVERAKKNQTIYTPVQMYFIVENAKVEGKKFSVKEMGQNEFYDFKKLVNRKGINWSRDTNGNTVYWSKVREVTIKTGMEDTIFFKYGLDEPQHSIKTTYKVTSSRRRRNVTETDAEVDSLQPAYSAPIPLPKPLYKDLISLCDSGVIPERYQTFYRGLTVQDQPQEQNNSDDSSLEE